MHAPSTREWSRYQLAVYSDFEDNSGHTVIEAVAGSGKTTSLVEGLARSPRGLKTQVCAFNKPIQQEFERRVRRGSDVRTYHSLGLSVVRRAFGDVRVDENKTRRIAREVCISHGLKFTNAAGETIPLAAAQVEKLASHAKNTLATNGDNEAEFGRLHALLVEYDIEIPDRIPPLDIVRAAAEVLVRGAEERDAVDFDDMTWFPARLGLMPATHDLVVVDEAQDTNAAQLYLARSVCKSNGRIVLCGDRYQAIYGWRGAKANVMSEMTAVLGAKTLPLSISYRCPQAVAELAREVVPHFEVPPTAEPGIVRTATAEQLYRDARPGDFVLARAKAPLVSGALRMIAQGIPACVAGRDVGKMLLSVVRKSKMTTVPDLFAWLRVWKDRESDRLRRLDRPDKIEEVEDTVAALSAAASGAASLSELEERLERLFSDADPKAKVVFSTVHRAKGLERERVWMIAPTFKLWPGEEWAEERNLYYVAVTRAQRELVLVGEVRR